MTERKKGSPPVPFHFRVGPQYIDYWAHNFTHWDSTDGQNHTMADLEESLKSLLKKRDRVQEARGSFGPVSVYYPNAHLFPLGYFPLRLLNLPAALLG